MEHVSTFFKEENDIFYKVGEKRGIEKGLEQDFEKGSVENSKKEKTIFVTNLLSQTDFPATKIAALAGVTEAFVRKIKRGL